MLRDRHTQPWSQLGSVDTDRRFALLLHCKKSGYLPAFQSSLGKLFRVPGRIGSSFNSTLYHFLDQLLDRACGGPGWFGDHDAGPPGPDALDQLTIEQFHHRAVNCPVPVSEQPFRIDRQLIT